MVDVLLDCLPAGIAVLACISSVLVEFSVTLPTVHQELKCDLLCNKGSTDNEEENVQKELPSAATWPCDDGLECLKSENWLKKDYRKVHLSPGSTLNVAIS